MSSFVSLMESATVIVRTDSWPVHRHDCPAKKAHVDLKFRGACRNGARVVCTDGCGVTFQYVKPRPARSIGTMDMGGRRTHF